ncbi:MAG TPA: hypothetical protein VJZ77_05435, partial [Blastocatellia bacterium]|nr:hypothetical protein [Blastocatellia bacterium]
IFHAPAGLKFDLTLRSHGLATKLRPLGCVPSNWRNGTSDRPVIRRNAGNQPVFARREIAQ